MIQYPKRTKSAGLAGQDQIHIYKDPPAAKYTRKYEPVNIGDVMYMARPDSEYGDPTRFNEIEQSILKKKILKLWYEQIYSSAKLELLETKGKLQQAFVSKSG